MRGGQLLSLTYFHGDAHHGHDDHGNDRDRDDHVLHGHDHGCVPHVYGHGHDHGHSSFHYVGEDWFLYFIAYEFLSQLLYYLHFGYAAHDCECALHDYDRNYDHVHGHDYAHGHDYVPHDCAPNDHDDHYNFYGHVFLSLILIKLSLTL